MPCLAFRNYVFSPRICMNMSAPKVEKSPLTNGKKALPWCGCPHVSGVHQKLPDKVVSGFAVLGV